MSMNKRNVTEIFQSMMQPLRQAKQAEGLNIFSNEMLRKTDKITTRINQDPFCLRELLAEDETYGVMAEIAKEKNKEVQRALWFLRDLSLLVKSDYFAAGGFGGKGVTTVLALKYADCDEIKSCLKSHSHSHVTLIESLIFKSENDLKIVEPVLRKFVTSDFFIKRANLLPSIRDAEDKYQYRLKDRISRGGECIELFLIENEEHNKWKPSRPDPEIPDTIPDSRKKTRNKGVLEILGLIAPFLVLAAIPVVGLPLSLAVFSVLGLASFAYYMAPENKQNMQKQTEKDSQKQAQRMDKNEGVAVEAVVNTPRLANRYQNISPKNDEIMKRRRQSSVVIGERKSLYSQERENIADTQTEKGSAKNNHKEERKWTYGTEITEEISFGHRMQASVDAKAILGGGRFIVEDRKRRREMAAANDEFKMNNPVSASESEMICLRGVEDGSDYDLSGYESFPDIEAMSDDEEMIDAVQQYRLAPGK